MARVTNAQVMSELAKITARLDAQAEQSAAAHESKSRKRTKKSAPKSKVLVGHLPLWGKPKVCHEVQYLAVGDSISGIDRDTMRDVNALMAGKGSNFASTDWDSDTKFRTYVRRDTQTRKSDGIAFKVSTKHGEIRRIA